MTRFTQLHFLTCYAPSNLNRDDLGRPKTALFGGAQRLRVSSQSLKRAWRTSDVFESALKDHIGTRTKDFGNLAYKKLKEAFGPEKADALAKKIAEQYGALKGKGDDEAHRQTETLVHATPGEMGALDKLLQMMVKEKRGPSADELAGLIAQARGAADVALFGRMLAAKPEFNVEAAAQVAHALSIHKVAIEDDYFTAVDDLNEEKDETGAGHVGRQEFAAAVLYHYVCIDRGQLMDNLGGNKDLVVKTLDAFVRACLTVAPSGKQNSFGSRAHASYALAEKGDFQPRSLAVAFLEPVKGEKMLTDAIRNLKETRERFDTVYGVKSMPKSLDVAKGEGSLDELAKFVSEE